MIRVYFDDVLIDTESYVQIDNEYKLFTDTFKLGSVACDTFKLGVLKSAVTKQPSEVLIEDDNTTWHFIVDSVVENDDIYVYTLVDKLMNFNFNYDASEIIEEKQNNGENCYLSDIWKDMCLKANVEYDEDYVFENDIVVNWYDNRKQARRYLSYIAELQSGYACVLENGKQSFKKQNRSSVKTIDADECSDIIVGEKKKITRVVFDNGVNKWDFGDETGETLYLQSDNVYITNETIVENIYNNIKDFEFYIIDVPQAPIDSSIRAGDLITFIDGDKEYLTIAQYSMSYYGNGWTGRYELKVSTSKQQETNVTKTNEIVRNLEINVNRLENEFEIKVEEINENTSKIASLELTASGLNSTVTNLSNQTAQLTMDVNALRGEIGDVTDITSQEEGYGELQFDNVNASEPINMLIKATADGDVANIYPSNYLYPSSTLYPRSLKMYFHNTSTDEVFEYTLPGDLRYYNGASDEFQWDYENQSCRIIRRIGVNEDLTKYVLEEEIIENYDMPLIFLSTGNYTINIPSFPNAYMKIRLMSQNMYTSQFATKVELNATISVTKDEINSEVSKKVGNDEIISKINQSAEAIQIDANKISLAGKTINLTTDNIAINSTNFNVNKDGIVTANGFKGTNVEVSGKITANDGTIGSWNINSDFIGVFGGVNETIFLSKNGKSAYVNQAGSSPICCLYVKGNFAVTNNGTLYARNAYVSGVINATSGSFNGSIVGGTININNRFKVYSGGGVELTSAGGGFLTIGQYTNNPWASSLNVSAASGGIVVTNGTSLSNVGSNLAQFTGNAGGHALVIPVGGYAYVNSVAPNNKIAVSSSGPSSRNVKTNLEILNNYDNIYKDLEKLNLYTFDYKYEGIKENKNDFGFIIDEIEELPTISKFTKHYEVEGYIENGKLLPKRQYDTKKANFKYKEWDRDSYIKTLFVLLKSLQLKIDELEVKLNAKTN